MTVVLPPEAAYPVPFQDAHRLYVRITKTHNSASMYSIQTYYTNSRCNFEMEKRVQMDESRIVHLLL